MQNELRLVEFSCQDFMDKDGYSELCYVTKKGYFHKWATFSDSNETEELGIIEDEDGNVHLVKPTDVKFIRDNN